MHHRVPSHFNWSLLKVTHNQLFAVISMCFVCFQRLYQNRSPVMDDISNNFNRVPYRCQIWLGDDNKTISQVSLVSVNLLTSSVCKTYILKWVKTNMFMAVGWVLYCHIWIMTLCCHGHVSQHFRDLGCLSCMLSFSTSVKYSHVTHKAGSSWPSLDPLQAKHGNKISS